MDPPSMESGRFFPIKIGEGDSHFGKVALISGRWLSFREG